MVGKLALVGGILGGLIGAGIGIASGYALAEFVGVEHRETQAYFQVFVAMPACGLIGLLTGAAALAAIASERKLALGVVALLGAAALLFALVLGIRWHTPKRPAEFRVRNDTSAAFEQTYLGHDFRRTRSIGSVGAGATSDYVEVDLDERGTFNAVRGAQHGRQFQLTLELEQQQSLDPGRYTYVVREVEGQLTLELVTE